MAKKEMKTQIILKHDIEANWNLANSFYPVKGQVIIYDAESETDQLPEGRDFRITYQRMKMGDGTKLPKDLPFIDLKANEYTDQKIADLINGAPDTLDTLKEIADAMKENKDVVEALEEAIAKKVDKVTGKQLSTNDFTNEYKNKLDSLTPGGGESVSPAVQDTGVPGTLSIYRSNGFRTYGANGQLLICPASPKGYEMNTSSGTDEITAKSNRNKALVPLFIDYAVTSATHQQMSDSYDPANNINDTPAYKASSTSFRDFAGAQPVSYNAVKNYVDNKVGTSKPIEPMFELIGSWKWEDIDMRLDSSYSSAVGNSGTIGKYLEVPLSNGWTIINPYKGSAPSITRIARYNFPNGKAYKKVIAMMSFDPNYIPEGYITSLEQSRGFKAGVNYGQKFDGDPVYSTVRFIGDMGGASTLGYIESHNKDDQGFVKVANTKEGGLWTLTRTERTDNPGNRSDLRHYQGGFYGSYDSIQPIFHEEPYDASILGSYERVTGFEFETTLPWYDTDNNGSGDNLNNLRGMLSLYGIPEENPETVYGLKFHDITLVNNTDKSVACRTKQYEGGVVCTTVYNIGLDSLDVMVETASGKTINPAIKYHTDASHHGETRGYITFDMPYENVNIIITGGDDPSTGERYHYSVGNWPGSLAQVEIYPHDGIKEGIDEGWATAGSEVEVQCIGESPYGYWFEVADPTGKESPIEVRDTSSFIMPNYDVVINIYEYGGSVEYEVSFVDQSEYSKFDHITQDNMSLSWSVPEGETVEFTFSMISDGIAPYAIAEGNSSGTIYYEGDGDAEIPHFIMPDEDVTVTLYDK